MNWDLRHRKSSVVIRLSPFGSLSSSLCFALLAVGGAWCSSSRWSLTYTCFGGALWRPAQASNASEVLEGSDPLRRPSWSALGIRRTAGQGESVGNRLPVTIIRTTLARPSETSTADTLRSRLAPVGVSGFAGGKPLRAIVADVHPIHHPPLTSFRARHVGGSNRRRPRMRIAPHTPAQPMLYAV
jgi:hypothetical protein